jgi:leucyl-tRNA synthetase
MILGENGEKMSKSRGNVVNPDDMVSEYGADTLRLYEMFIGDFEKAAPWNTSSIKGCRRFLERFWALQDTVSGGDELSPRLEGAFHKTIKKVSGDIECLKFNTAIAAMMALMNDISEAGSVTRGELKILTILLNPFAPHITEEVWDRQKLGEGFVAQQKWPEYDESKCRDDTVEIAVQVNGKVRARLTVDAGIDQKAAVEKAEAVSKVAAEIEGKRIVKEIYVPRKLVNIVAK